jgi:hypothetical protein
MSIRPEECNADQAIQSRNTSLSSSVIVQEYRQLAHRSLLESSCTYHTQRTHNFLRRFNSTRNHLRNEVGRNTNDDDHRENLKTTNHDEKLAQRSSSVRRDRHDGWLGSWRRERCVDGGWMANGWESMTSNPKECESYLPADQERQLNLNEGVRQIL